MIDKYNVNTMYSFLFTLPCVIYRPFAFRSRSASISISLQMKHHPCLWRPLYQTSNGDSNKILALTRDEEEREFYRARHIPLDKLLKSYDINSSLTIVEPARLSLLEIMNSTLALGQKVALATFLLAIYRVIVHQESTRIANGESLIVTVLICSTLLIVVFYRQKAFTYSSPCFIIPLSISVWLTTTSFEKIIFLCLQWTVMVLFPYVKWHLQKHKRHMYGDWDIYHISKVELGGDKK